MHAPIVALASRPMDRDWNYLRETMINIKYRRYPVNRETKALDINCGTFRMEKNSFVSMLPAELSHPFLLEHNLACQLHRVGTD